jgi:hypothetical protein
LVFHYVVADAFEVGVIDGQDGAVGAAFEPGQLL